MMLLAPVRRQLERTAPSPFSLVVEPGWHPAVFSTSDQHQHVVIRTGAFDLIEASPERRGRFVSLFEDLLSALDVRIQLHVASRLSSGEACADSKLARYLSERALTNPSYERTVHLVLSDTPPQIERLAARWHRMRGNVVATTPDAAIGEALLRQADGAISQLRGMGLHPLLLEGMALHRFLDLHVPHPLTRPEVAYDWSESPDQLDLDGVLHRTYLLNGYPAPELLPGSPGPLLDLSQGVRRTAGLEVWPRACPPVYRWAPARSPPLPLASTLCRPPAYCRALLWARAAHGSGASSAGRVAGYWGSRSAVARRCWSTPS